MRFDFTPFANGDDYVNLKPGWYTVCVHEVREGTTRDGDPRWGLLLRVAEGEFTGRFAAWDGLAFSERGGHRAKLLLDALEIETNGEVELTPSDLLGRLLDVQLAPEEYENPDTGRTQRRNRVPYEGFAVAGSSRAAGHAAGASAVAENSGDRNQPVDGRGGWGESCAHESDPDGTSSVPF